MGPDCPCLPDEWGREQASWGWHYPVSPRLPRGPGALLSVETPGPRVGARPRSRGETGQDAVGSVQVGVQGLPEGLDPVMVGHAP